MTKHLGRIEREADAPGLVNILAGQLEPTDLQSLLLEVYRQRSQALTPADILSNYQANRFVRPSALEPRRVVELEHNFLNELPSDFSALELSPVCPLGTSSAVAVVAQNWSVATSRNTEVVSDATNVLALECAVRRREITKRQPKSREPVHLAASHRFLRSQLYGDPKQVPHFRMFSLCSGGRDQGNSRFEFANLMLQIGVYLRALNRFLGSTTSLSIYLTDFHEPSRTETIENALIFPLKEQFPQVDFLIDGSRESGRGYYLDLCFYLYALAPSGESIQLADGGSVNWTQLLLSNAKERLIISGISTERICTAFE